MPIEFRCTNCNKLLRTSDGTAGQQAKCPECEAIQTIPTPPIDLATPAAPQGGFPPPPEEPPEGTSFGGTPFGSPGERSTPSGFDEYPYQSLAGGLPPRGVGTVISADLRAYAMQRVSGPGMALLITGVLALLVQVWGTIGSIMRVRAGAPLSPIPQVAEFLKELGPAVGIVMIGTGLFGIAMAILLIAGGIRMRQLKSYGLAMTATIVAVIPCISPCCLLGLPFGIWALVVLLDKQVSVAFG